MKKNFVNLTLLVIVLTILFSSCATIFGRSAYDVIVNSNPSGATLSITDKNGLEVYKGATPATVRLKSSSGFFAKAQYQVKITSPGYAEQIIPVIYKLNGWYWGNLLIGGVLGMLIIDPATGAMWELETPPISVQLNKQNASIKNPELQIINISSLPKSMKDKLVRIN